MTFPLPLRPAHLRLALLFLCTAAAGFSADYLTGQAARLVIGQPNFTALSYTADTNGNAIPTSNLLGAAGGVAYAADTLFVVDGDFFGGYPQNNRVLIYTPVSGFPTPYGFPSSTDVNNEGLNQTCPACLGNPALVLGQPNFTTNGTNLTQAGMYVPTAVASDGTVLAVADTDNNRVLIWKTIPTSNNQPADFVIGQPDFTHNSVPSAPSAASLRGPQGVWLWNGHLFVADTFNNRVLIYNSIPAQSGASADVVLGQSDFTSVVQPGVTEQTVPPTQSNLQSPTSVTTDGTHLFVTDLGHDRVLIWNSIPTSNNVPADVVIGQPDFVSQVDNNAPVLCASNGTDSNNNPTYPVRCGATLSFPRFSLADDQGRLYIADGGNDRVLVFKTIPTAPKATADFILGEPDEFSDDTSTRTDSLATPNSLAWDGANLWVADSFNLRVLAYTPLGGSLPQSAVRNGASLQIYATGTITFTGTPAAKDTIALAIGSATYTYTVQTNDTLANIVTGLVNLVNGAASGSTPDANVIAVGDTANPSIILTARTAGVAGEGLAYSITPSSSSLVVGTTSNPTLIINLADPTSIAPGTLISIFGTNLATQTAAADFSGTYLPFSLDGTTVFVDGVNLPLLYISPTQINAQMPFYLTDRTSVSVMVVNNANGVQTATNAIGVSIVQGNPGLFAGAGNDPRPGILYHYTPYDNDLISVDGTIQAGDVANITVGSNTYTYTVQSTDTLTTVRDALVAAINADPNVTATPTNTYTRIFLQSKQPDPANNGLAVTATVTGTNAMLSLTAFNTTLCCGTPNLGAVTMTNPAVPREVVYTYATGLGITGTDSPTGMIVSPTDTLYPTSLPVDSILAGTQSGQIINATLVPGTVGVYQVTFLLPSNIPSDPLTQLTIAQQLFVSNIVTFPVAVPASSTAEPAAIGPRKIPAQAAAPSAGKARLR